MRIKQSLCRTGRITANLYANLVEQVFRDETNDTNYYNNQLADGKWKGIMSNAHIGQTGWETPQRNIMPTIHRIPVEPGSEMGIAVEGSKTVYTQPGEVVKTLPTFNSVSRQRYYFDIFNTKMDPFVATIVPSEPWIITNLEKKIIEEQSRVWIDIDWEKAPKGERLLGKVDVIGVDKTITVEVLVNNWAQEEFPPLERNTFIESEGYISIEAEHYSSNVEVDGLSWQKIDGYGRTLSSMAVFPTTGPHRIPPDAPYLEYKLYINEPSNAVVTVYTAPTNNINRNRGLYYGIGLNDKNIQLVDTFPKENDAFYTSPLWSQGVMENVRKTSTRHQLDPGLTY